MSANIQQLNDVLDTSGLMKNLSPQMMKLLKLQYQNASEEEITRAIASIKTADIKFGKNKQDYDAKKMELAQQIHDAVSHEKTEEKAQKMAEMKSLESESRKAEADILNELIKNL